MQTDQIIIATIFIFVGLYAIMKEREELGCYSSTTSSSSPPNATSSMLPSCDDNQSVYVVNTKMKEGDDCDTLLNRLKSIVSYHEKGGVWKRCFIIALIAIVFVYMVVHSQSSAPDANRFTYAIIFLLFFTLIYFYHNYINYHHFRKLKENANEIISSIRERCLR